MDLTWVGGFYEAAFAEQLHARGLPIAEARHVAARLADPETLRPYLERVDVQDKRAVVRALTQWANERLDVDPFVWWYPMSLDWL